MKKLMSDIAAFTNVLGPNDPDLVWYLATIPWESEQDRNSFIVEIGSMNGGVSQ